MARLRIGKREDFAKIQPVELKGQDGGSLTLGYKTSSYWFVGGLHLSDDGYVLLAPGDTYYEMPEGAELKAYQEQGLLPDPLPPYQIPAIEYAFGYSLWIILAAMAAWGFIKSKMSPKPPEPEPPPAEATS